MATSTAVKPRAEDARLRRPVHARECGATQRLEATHMAGEQHVSVPQRVVRVALVAVLLLGIAAAVGVWTIFALGLGRYTATLSTGLFHTSDSGASTRHGAPHTSANAAADDSPVFGFVFSTGRCATAHLAAVFLDLARHQNAQSASRPQPFVTHQTEHNSMPTKLFVDRYYRQLVSLPRAAVASVSDQDGEIRTPDAIQGVKGGQGYEGESEKSFEAAALAFVRQNRLPFYLDQMRRHGPGVHTHIFTGHVPLAFGMADSLLEVLPGTVRIVRMRRDRIQLALSLMALGPASQDAWAHIDRKPGNERRQDNGSMRSDETSQLRWFASPHHAHVLLRPPLDVWRTQLNRFQKYLWYVDDTECRWQALLRRHAAAIASGRLRVLETSVEELEQISFRTAYARIAHFWGLSVGAEQDGDSSWNPALLAARHNSIQSKKRDKILSLQEVQDTAPAHLANETWLREMDDAYRLLVGACQISPTETLSWA
ncbi:hypothetical protein FVE85_0038 [Porphyridium purpureum]|uniref:Sulfotransferase domain-containing protein n=1 Tax=Porphyridium purpureum TaxID=35688 RepID=A0A5J4YXK0_PORPP|nr:hypothetical protein FVE85_0038 [Porphyridium purpureum]|eukprot:POR0277..scf208_2